MAANSKIHHKTIPDLCYTAEYVEAHLRLGWMVLLPSRWHPVGDAYGQRQSSQGRRDTGERLPAKDSHQSRAGQTPKRVAGHDERYQPDQRGNPLEWSREGTWGISRNRKSRHDGRHLQPYIIAGVAHRVRSPSPAPRTTGMWSRTTASWSPQ
jgi:hypothetical protein